MSRIIVKLRYDLDDPEVLDIENARRLLYPFGLEDRLYSDEIEGRCFHEASHWDLWLDGDVIAQGGTIKALRRHFLKAVVGLVRSDESLADECRRLLA